MLTPLSFPPPAPASGRFAVFASHCWGEDAEGRDNHKRVLRVCQRLEAAGISCWVDENEMSGSLMGSMTSGIDASSVVLVFVTRRYMEKLASGADDNCGLEFNYAKKRKGVRQMLPVVMEAGMRDQSKWEGMLGALNDRLYISLGDDGHLGEGVARLAEEVRKMLP